MSPSASTRTRAQILQAKQIKNLRIGEFVDVFQQQKPTVFVRRYEDLYGLQVRLEVSRLGEHLVGKEALLALADRLRSAAHALVERQAHALYVQLEIVGGEEGADHTRARSVRRVNLVNGQRRGDRSDARRRDAVHSGRFAHRHASTMMRMQVRAARCRRSVILGTVRLI